MSRITFRSPVTKPLLRAGTAKPVPPDPRAYDTFRVTQQFDSIDAYWADVDRKAGRTPRTHQATDIGNFRCGDPIVAMAPGIAYRVKDNATALGAPTDALGIRIDHGNGITTEYWHLDGYTVANGMRVIAGQQIGIVGDTGLKAVCHCHIEAKRDGAKFDPEPLMFGGSVTVDEEDPMEWAAQIQILNPPEEVTYRAETSYRKRPDLSADSKPVVLGYADRRVVVGTVAGQDFGAGPIWDVMVSNNGGLIVAHSQDRVGAPTALLPTNSLALENRLDGIAEAAQGLVQAATAIQRLAVHD